MAESIEAPPAEPPAAPAGAANRVFHANHFKVDIPGVGTAQFVQVSGLAVNVARIPFRGGGEGQIVHYLPGQIDLAPVVFRYGVTSSPGLWEWMKASMEGQLDLKNVSVIYLDSDCKTILKRYELHGAWPCQWTAAELHSMENQVAIESLAITYEKIERA